MLPHMTEMIARCLALNLVDIGIRTYFDTYLRRDTSDRIDTYLTWVGTKRTCGLNEFEHACEV